MNQATKKIETYKGSDFMCVLCVESSKAPLRIPPLSLSLPASTKANKHFVKNLNYL
jgi:hypothetical protein